MATEITPDTAKPTPPAIPRAELHRLIRGYMRIDDKGNPTDVKLAVLVGKHGWVVANDWVADSEIVNYLDELYGYDDDCNAATEREFRCVVDAVGDVIRRHGRSKRARAAAWGVMLRMAEAVRDGVEVDAKKTRAAFWRALQSKSTARRGGKRVATELKN
jgi:hypothetical protein